MTENNTFVVLLYVGEDNPPVGVSVEFIDELLRIPTEEIRKVPRAKPVFKGVFLLRDITVPVFDLEHLLFTVVKGGRVPPSSFHKTPVLVLNIKNTKIGFTFTDVIKYTNVKPIDKPLEEINVDIKVSDAIIPALTNDETPQECLLIDPLKLFDGFLKGVESSSKPEKTGNKETDNDDDFDLDQFTLKEGENFDINKFTL